MTNQILADFMAGVMDATEGEALQPQFPNTPLPPAAGGRTFAAVATQRPAGMVVTGIDQSPEARRIIEEMGCPVVQVLEVNAGPDRHD